MSMKNLIEVFMICAFAFIGYQIGHSNATDEFNQNRAVEKLVKIAKENPKGGWTLWDKEGYVLIILTDEWYEEGKKLYHQAKSLTESGKIGEARK